MLTCKSYLEFLPKCHKTSSKNGLEVLSCHSISSLFLLLCCLIFLACLFFLACFQLIPGENYFFQVSPLCFQILSTEIHTANKTPCLDMLLFNHLSFKIRGSDSENNIR